jgi:PadR family transcriptional regulator PadR
MDDISSKLLYGCLETLVLAALAKEPLHGYALKWTLAEKSKYHIQPVFGRLYPLLATLERRGLIAGSIEPAGCTRVRKVYAITARGRTRLAFLIRQWNGFQSAVNTFLRPPA